MMMLPQRDDVATKDDITGVRTEIADLRTDVADVRGEIADVRSEIASLRLEMEYRFATKGDLLELRRDFDVSLRAFVRTFTTTQAATVVGMTGIFHALVRLT